MRPGVSMSLAPRGHGPAGRRMIGPRTGQWPRGPSTGPVRFCLSHWTLGRRSVPHCPPDVGRSLTRTADRGMAPRDVASIAEAKVALTQVHDDPASIEPRMT